MKYRYVMLYEDGDMEGTNEDSVAQATALDPCTVVIDCQEGKQFYMSYTEEEPEPKVRHYDIPEFESIPTSPEDL
jgi:hypothetical protein